MNRIMLYVYSLSRFEPGAVNLATSLDKYSSQVDGCFVDLGVATFSTTRGVRAYRIWKERKRC